MRIPLLAAVLIFATIAPAAPQTIPATLPATRPISREEVDLVVAPLLDGWVDGFVVGIIDETGGRRFYSYGRVADPRPGTPDRKPDEHTEYEIGSVTKVFTSLLLTDRVVQGKMSLDAPAQQYLPESVKLPHRGDQPITLAHLASHFSGLPRMPDNFHPKDPRNPYADYTVEQMYAFLNAVHPERDPGKAFEYSNLGVSLLGHILARQAGTSYEELVVTRICEPLKMRDTRITLSADQRRRLSPGHDPEGDPTVNWDNPTFAAAGAICSTADDMLTFLAFQIGLENSREKLPELARAADMTHIIRAPLAEGVPTSIGLGWHIETKRPVIWHNGQTGGYHSFVGFNTQRREGVVILSNSSVGAIDRAGMMLLARTSERPALPVWMPKVVPVDPKVADSYVGTFMLNPLAFVQVTKEQEKLYIQVTGEPRFRILATSPTEFFLRSIGTTVSFVAADGANAPAKLVLHHAGRDSVAVKMKGAAQTQPAK